MGAVPFASTGAESSPGWLLCRAPDLAESFRVGRQGCGRATHTRDLRLRPRRSTTGCQWQLFPWRAIKQILAPWTAPPAAWPSSMANDLATLRETDLANVRATSIGFIFQTFNLIPTLSAQENAETALAPLRVTGADRRTRAAQALAGVGLAERLNHLPSELSGGQQQRVAIARVRNPARRLSGPRLRQRRSGLA